MKISALLFLTVLSLNALGQSITIGTWNIEHLGSAGRGFPEYKGQGFEDRTDNEFQLIANFIRDSISMEIVGVQEVALTTKNGDVATSKELLKITEYLGKDWKYYLANFEGGQRENDEMQNAFIYNSALVELKCVFEMEVPNYEVGGASLFDRKPLVGYFVPVNSDDGFVVVNLHLASGQNNDENHLAAMVIVQQNLKRQLESKDVDKNEKDFLILGDLNDNPFKLKKNGECCETSNLMYEYMQENRFVHLVDGTFGSTRMNKELNSIIDHIFVSSSAKKHINQDKASMYRLNDLSRESQRKWRANYSDHFPLYVEYAY